MKNTPLTAWDSTMYSTNLLKPPSPPGSHFGPLPDDLALLVEIRAANAVGWRTTMASTWEALEALGVGPDDLGLA